MIRHEVFGPDGNCISAVQLDPTTRLVSYEENGVFVSSRAMTEEEWLSVAPFPPLDSAGALATLLVIQGILPLEDAANAIREEPQHLVAEAEAWSLSQ